MIHDFTVVLFFTLFLGKKNKLFYDFDFAFPVYAVFCRKQSPSNAMDFLFILMPPFRIHTMMMEGRVALEK